MSFSYQHDIASYRRTSAIRGVKS